MLKLIPLYWCCVLFIMLPPARAFAAECDLSCPAFANRVNRHCIGSRLCHDWVCNPKYDRSTPGQATRIVIDEANAICKKLVDANERGTQSLSKVEAASVLFADFAEITQDWSSLYSKCGTSEEARSTCWENLPAALSYLAGFRAAFLKIAHDLGTVDEMVSAKALLQVRSIDEAIAKIQLQVSQK